MIRADNIAIQVIDDMQVNQKYLEPCIRWIREAIILIGLPPESHMKSCEVPVDGEMGLIEKPKDIHHLQDMHLIGVDNCKYDVYFRGRLEGPAYNITIHPDQKTGYGKLQIAEDANYYFFYQGDPKDFKTAIISYTGIPCDTDGTYLVDNRTEIAVKAYLELKITKQERIRDRNAVPMSEINTLDATWRALLKDAYAKLKGPSRKEYESMSLRFRQPNYPLGFNQFGKKTEVTSGEQGVYTGGDSLSGGESLPSDLAPVSQGGGPIGPDFGIYDFLADWDRQPWETNGQNDLLFISLLAAGGGNIATINSYPTGVVTFPDTSTHNVVWNAVEEKYEPETPFSLPEDGTYSLSIPGVSITLNNGATGQVEFTQNFAYTFIPQGVAPEVTNVRIDGIIESGRTVTLTGDFTDGDGDGNSSILRLLQYDDIDGIVNEQVLWTGAHDGTYVIPSEAVTKYLKLEYRPIDDTAAEGTTQFSVIEGPVDVGPYSSPTELGSLLMSWWDFSDGGQLSDIEGNSSDFVLVGSGTNPFVAADVVGTLDALEFEDQRYYRTTLPGGITRDYTCFIALKTILEGGGFSYPIQHTGGANATGFTMPYQISSNKHYLIRYSGPPDNLSSIKFPSLITLLPSPWQVFTMQNESIDASNDQCRFYINQTLALDNTEAANTYNNPLYLDIGFNVYAQIGEIVLVNGAMTTEQTIRTIKYLEERWLP